LKATKIGIFYLIYNTVYILFMGGCQREWNRETQRSSCALLYTLHGWLAKNGREKHKGHSALCCTHFMGGWQRMEERNTKVIVHFAVHTSWVASKDNGREKHKGHHLLYCTLFMGD
jgi:hypothetical protein